MNIYDREDSWITKPFGLSNIHAIVVLEYMDQLPAIEWASLQWAKKGKMQ